MSHFNNIADDQYLTTMEDLLKTGDPIEGRNGSVITKFGHQLKFDLSTGKFPLLTSKKTHFKSIVVELLWFIKGGTNTDFLHKHGVTIWDEWADENGDLGPVYGKQWRSWQAGGYDEDGSFGEGIEPYLVDQFSNLIGGLKKDPYGRRHIISAWNPAEIEDMALPPCHCLFQFHVRSTGVLDLQLYQRSADWFLGVPFNIASYALLLILVAREVGLKVGEFTHTFGNYHLYENHMEQAVEQVNREFKGSPTITIPSQKGIFDLEPNDILLSGYEPQPAIKAPVSK